MDPIDKQCNLCDSTLHDQQDCLLHEQIYKMVEEDLQRTFDEEEKENTDPNWLFKKKSEGTSLQIWKKRETKSAKTLL